MIGGWGISPKIVPGEHHWTLLILSEVLSELLWHSLMDNFMENSKDNYPSYEFQDCLFKITAPSRGQWVNLFLLMYIAHIVSIVGQCPQNMPFLKTISCPTSRILKFFDLLIWNKEEKSVQIHLPDW